MEDEMYFLFKEIYFLGRSTKILCQNENGPCPLLAIANVMILRNRLNFHPDVSMVSLSEIVQEVGNLFLESSGNLDHLNNHEINEAVDTALRILPTLGRGLDLNIKFSDVSSFEYTQELSVFDILNIALYHAWIVDDNDTMKVILHDMSYNNLVFKVAEYQSILEKVERKTIEQKMVESTVFASDHLFPSTLPRTEEITSTDGNTIEHISQNSTSPGPGDGSGDNDGGGNGSGNDHGDKKIAVEPMEIGSPINQDNSKEQSKEPNDIIIPSLPPLPSSTPSLRSSSSMVKLSESEENLVVMGQLYEEFLTTNSSQMTYVGLLKLYATIKERQLSVLFHNNHFSTIFKYESKLYLLVTDVDYKDVIPVVWELLDEIDGDTVFANSNFQIVREVDLIPKENTNSLGLLELNDRIISERRMREDETRVEIPSDIQIQSNLTTAPVQQGQQHQGQEIEQYSNHPYHSVEENDFELAMRLQREEEMLLIQEENENRVTQSTTTLPSHQTSPRPTPSTTRGQTTPVITLAHQESDHLPLNHIQQQRELEYYQQLRQSQIASRQGTRPLSSTPTSPSSTTNRRSSSLLSTPTNQQATQSVATAQVTNHRSNEKSNNCVIS